MVKRGIKTEDELLSLAWVRAKDGEPDFRALFRIRPLRRELSSSLPHGECSVLASCWSGHVRPGNKLYLRH